MNLWQLTHSNARLSISSLQATVDISSPALGVHALSWNAQKLEGSLLGVTVADVSSRPAPLTTEGMECYVRGNDLVANYPQNHCQRFSLQVYWRVAATAADLPIIDAIVSLQTSLLECFPKAVLNTKLAASEALAIAKDSERAITIEDQMSSDEPVGVLVRWASHPWSYFEVTHPTDLGCWRVSRNDGLQMERELGGDFQEKGVIRRLRVRGALVARERDEQIARQILGEFTESDPPLTA